MDFIETMESKQFGNYTIVLEEYEDENGKLIYNVSIEFNFNNGLFTQTLDIFESRKLKKATRFYNMLLLNIEKTNILENSETNILAIIY